MNAFALLLSVLLSNVVLAQEGGKRPDWDQDKAVKIVEGVLKLEKVQGQPWNKIDWMTDVDKAVARARKENKPIFLYFHVPKGGPPRHRADPAVA